ncbi:helix-turn-helix domain-containing protein [Rhizobium sp. AB2/73]|uniref:helix-turn-helix domain-containing protein n=1 Tax=Rhizobium sp. AB2/73 TaxID=2795216 RepID=UPI000DDD264D|nr:helix-turn-helix domain-containing protein [Rhizobium sp. AB2/73]QYA11710.1 helix-turn-helix domain-containing protein [Rhizobium sp. AB2/73]UEQ82360.1 helix-turn-helix domain-containing protein [Rhizobium sp. AB2/73]
MSVKKFVCSCCGSEVNNPSLLLVIDEIGLSKQEGRLLEVVWRANGNPVMPERALASMYADDPNGGPEPGRKGYLAFKVTLCHLRKKLRDYGVWIENIGYRQGYRLVLDRSIKFVPANRRAA